MMEGESVSSIYSKVPDAVGFVITTAKKLFGDNVKQFSRYTLVMAKMLRSIGNKDTTIQTAELVLEIAIGYISNKWGLRNQNVIPLLVESSKLYIEIDKLEAARRALILAEKLSNSSQGTPLLTDILVNQARVYRKLGLYSDAELAYQRLSARSRCKKLASNHLRSLYQLVYS